MPSRMTAFRPYSVPGGDRSRRVYEEIINILTEQNDPRTGSLKMMVTRINFNEPDPDIFAISPEYKVVDVTPPELESPKSVHVEL